MKNGFVVEEGNGVIVLTRAAGVSEEFFTRGKEFVPERYGRHLRISLPVLLYLLIDTSGYIFFLQWFS